MLNKSTRVSRLIGFLQEELGIPADWIAIATRQSESDASVLPMILWQYGLVSIDQLDKVFDWLATVG